MHCTKMSAEFEFGSHGPPGCASPKNVGSGYDVGKISAGCLVVTVNLFVFVTCTTACVQCSVWSCEV